MTLGNHGLEKIGKEALEECTLLQRIVKPPAGKAIKDSTFQEAAEFSNEIEEIVTCEVMLNWWNQGHHESLSVLIAP